MPPADVPDVRWSRSALGDLDAIGAYFEHTSPQYARSIVSRLYAAVNVLSDHPRSGRAVPEVEHVRELVREGYRIVYLVSDDAVEILAVLHGRQDLERKLRRE